MNIQILNINPTYQCTARCLHCRYFSSSQQRNDYMNGDDLDGYLDHLDSDRLRGVCIGGGEPLLDLARLTALIKVVKKRAHLKAHVISNSSWAASYERARHVADALACAGLDGVILSADGFHQEHVPIENVRHAALALLDSGIRSVSAAGILLGEDFSASQYDEITQINAETLREIPGLSVVTGGHVSLVGRGATEIPKHYKYNRTQKEFACNLQPWDGGDFKNLQAIMIDNLGFVSTCSGIAIGNVHNQPLRKILEDYDYQDHPIISVILEYGPKGLVEIAEKSGYIAKNDYVDGCHMCFEARRFLQKMLPNCLAPSQCYF